MAWSMRRRGQPVLDSGVMADERFEDHLRHPRGRRREVAGAYDGAAGGA
jgi:hypothetical protein